MPADGRTWPADDALWRYAYRTCGASPGHRRILTSFSEKLSWPYFNAGVIVVRDGAELAAHWEACCRQLFDDERVPMRFPWLDQICLPIAIERAQRAFGLLDRKWNYAVSLMPYAGSPIFCHYHSPEIIRQEALLNRHVIELASSLPGLRTLLRRHEGYADLLQGHMLREAGGWKRSGTDAVRADQGRRNLIVTGLPRTGTSLLCRLLHSTNNTVVINEPVVILKPLKEALNPYGVACFHRQMRAAILSGEAIPNKVEADGTLIDDTARLDQSSLYRPRITDPDFTMGSKNTLGYLMRLPDLQRVMPDARIVACVRDPVATIHSWIRSFGHLREGDIGRFPVSLAQSTVLAPSLLEDLRTIEAVDDPVLRRPLIWRMLAGWLLRILNDDIVLLRYEDLTEDPVGAVERVMGRELDEDERGRIADTIRPPRDGKELPAEDQWAIHDLCWPVASQFGYRRSAPAADTIASSVRQMPAERARMVGPAHQAEAKRAFQLGFLQASGLQPGHRLLDLGCGVLRGGVPLIRLLEAGHYVGLDISAERLRQARMELREQGLEHKQVQLLQGYEQLHSFAAAFDYIWAYQVLIHMPDEIAEESLDRLAQCLAPNGTIFGTVNLGPCTEGSWQEYPCVSRPLEFYRELAAARRLQVEVVPHSHPMLNNQMLRFTALRATPLSASPPGRATVVAG